MVEAFDHDRRTSDIDALGNLYALSTQRGQPKQELNRGQRTALHTDNMRQARADVKTEKLLDSKDQRITLLEEERARVCAAFPDAAKMMGYKPSRYFGCRKKPLSDEEARRLVMLSCNPTPKGPIGINVDRLRMLMHNVAKAEDTQGLMRLLHCLMDIRRANDAHLISIAHEHQSDSTLQTVSGVDHEFMDRVDRNQKVEVFTQSGRLHVSFLPADSNDIIDLSDYRIGAEPKVVQRVIPPPLGIRPRPRPDGIEFV
jgi:hypothetical protein